MTGQIVLAIVGQGSIAGVVEDLVTGRLGGVVVVGTVDAGIGPALAPLGQAAIAPVVAVDEEGGAVQRLASVLGDQPSARDLAGFGSAAIKEAGRVRAEGAAGLGFSMILAPVLDVKTSPGSFTRTYGDDAASVMEFGLAYADGIAEGGLVSVAKHFPGHGTADADSHDELATTSAFEVLQQSDLVPFQTAAAWVPAIMLGHLVVPGLTDGLPVTISAPAIDLLRNQLEFDGVVVTDDLSMGALSQWGPVASGEMALVAGADLLMAGSADEARALAALIVEAVGVGRVERARVDEAAARVLQMKGIDPCEIVLEIGE